MLNGGDRISHEHKTAGIEMVPLGELGKCNKSCVDKSQPMGNLKLMLRVFAWKADARDRLARRLVTLTATEIPCL